MQSLAGIDKVFVLSVKSFEDRIAHINTMLSRQGIRFEFVFAYDAADLSDDDLRCFGPGDMSLGAKSLILKTLAVWRRVAADVAIERALILEDDAIIAADFAEKMQAIAAAMLTLPATSLVSLGGSGDRLPIAFLRDTAILSPLKMTTTEAYIVNKTTAKMRLDWLRGKKITVPVDHLIGSMDKALGIVHYRPQLPLVEQGSITGLFETQLDRKRKRQGVGFARLKYRWKVIRHQIIKPWLVRLLFAKR
ncbi:MAG: glycosyltransferase family 25 protein [Cellvibrionaceae bacterium]|nr:glycosyltransferase family 25 protein [Cellvibrionaceae bacterium]